MTGQCAHRDLLASQWEESWGEQVSTKRHGLRWPRAGPSIARKAVVTAKLRPHFTESAPMPAQIVTAGGDQRLPGRQQLVDFRPHFGALLSSKSRCESSKLRIRVLLRVDDGRRRVAIGPRSDMLGDQDLGDVVDQGLCLAGADEGQVVSDLANAAARPAIGLLGVGMNTVDDGLLAVAEQFNPLISAVSRN